MAPRDKSFTAPPDDLINPIADAIVAAVLFCVFTAILARSSGLLHSQTRVLPRVIDAALAAASVAIALSICAVLDANLPFKCYDSKMLSSAVVFMGNPKPPSPQAFVTCSACGFVVGVVLNISHAASSLGSVHVQSVTLGLLLFFWRISGTSFSATVGLAAFLAQSEFASPGKQLKYVLAPWLTGHALLYALAHALALPRTRLRVFLAKREFQRANSISAGLSELEREAELKALFTKTDTSGDGRIDATEFKVAMRRLIGQDLPLADCEAVIQSVDADGNGSMDFSEFCAAVQSDALGVAKKGKAQ